MKKTVVLCVMALGFASQGLADFKMPKSVYRMAELEEARAKAKEKGRPLSFIYTEEATRCPHTIGGSLKAVDKLTSKTVVVYTDHQSPEKQNLPDIVKSAILSIEGVFFLPVTVIVDPEITKVLAIAPYSRDSPYDDSLKAAKKKALAGMPKKGTNSSLLVERPPVQPLQPDEDSAMRTWHPKRGSELTGAFVSESSGYLVLKQEDGTLLRILTSNLSKEDQLYVTQQKK